MTLGSILGGAFRLVRERPGAVAVWGVIYLALTAALALTLAPMFAKTAALSGDSPEAALQNMSSMMGGILLFQLVFFVVLMVLFAASQRAVLQPERQGFAYLRLGMDELRLLGLALLLLIGFYAGFVVATIVIGIVVGLLAVAVGAGPLVIGAVGYSGCSPSRSGSRCACRLRSH
jgi:hypothetical protein